MSIAAPRVERIPATRNPKGVAGRLRPGPTVYGASRTRTGDLLGAIQALSQLSYSPAPNSVAPALGGFGSRGDGLRGELERRRRAEARLGLDPDPPAHRADEFPADVEPEPRAADSTSLVRIEAVELLEDPLLLAERDPQALVSDGEAQPLPDARDRHVDATSRRRVLDRVVDEVEEHLPRALLVA